MVSSAAIFFSRFSKDQIPSSAICAVSAQPLLFLASITIISGADESAAVAAAAAKQDSKQAADTEELAEMDEVPDLPRLPRTFLAHHAKGTDRRAPVPITVNHSGLYLSGG